jgi:hypothetical protein
MTLPSGVNTVWMALSGQFVATDHWPTLLGAGAAAASVADTAPGDTVAG